MNQISKTTRIERYAKSLPTGTECTSCRCYDCTHTPAQPTEAQQRIEQVIEMLEQWKRGEMVDLTDDTWYVEIGSHKIDEAIALLQAGGKE